MVYVYPVPVLPSLQRMVTSTVSRTTNDWIASVRLGLGCRATWRMSTVSIVAIPEYSFSVSQSAFHAAERQARDQMFLHDEREHDGRDDDDHRHRAHAGPVDRELRGEVHQADRQRLGIGAAAQLRRERELVPARQEGEDTRR